MKLFPADNYFLLLQIRAAVAVAAASFLSGAAAAFSLFGAAFIETAFLSVYFIAAVFYIRPFTRALCVKADNGILLISKGVIFARSISVPLGAVRYFERRCSLLSRALGVYSVIAHTSSGNVRIGGLDLSAAEAIIGLRRESNEKDEK